MYSIGQWLFSKSHNAACNVIEVDHSWNNANYRVYISSANSIDTVSEGDLTSLSDSQNIEKESDRLAYVCAATKIKQLFSDFAEKKAVVAPSRSEIEPLPHQIEALKKIMSSNPVRFLLADEVGLGKTIEAGLVIEEMKLRYQIKRILVVVPKSLATQWHSEMDKHFGEDFKVINGNEIETLDRLFVSNGGAWKQFDQVIITHDSVKPLAKRRGWNKEKIDNYNKQRLGNLLSAGWDLIILDEGHRLSGTTEQVARYKLGKSLSDCAPNMLILTATPHQGKSDGFFRLMNILDEKAFPSEDLISKNTVKPYLVRTEKRKAITASGEKLFKDRKTSLVPIQWTSEHEKHQLLYEQVTEYAIAGYNKALKDKKPQIGFLMVLLQRLVSSSSSAIRTTLEKRLAVLENLEVPEKQQSDLISEEDVEAMTGEEQEEILVATSEKVLSEINTVKDLLELARTCEQTVLDPKAIALINLISSIMREESNYQLKVIIFTEFVATQMMLKDLFEKRNFSVELINGSMTTEERNDAMVKFEDSSTFLISTDAGGEGLNLQFAHVVINYDLPWNPMKIEQRIGRVDRIGQSQDVKVFNLILDSSVEYRIRQVIEEKLAIVAKELGIDKRADILETADNGNTIEKALTAAIMNPKKAEQFVNQAVADIKTDLKSEQKMNDILSDSSNTPDANSVRDVIDSPLSILTERMTTNFVKYAGGKAEKNNKKWTITWPNEVLQKNVIFDSSLNGNFKSTKDEDIATLFSNIPIFHKSMLIPRIEVNDIPEGLSGIWGLFCLEIKNGLKNIKKRYLNLDDNYSFFFPVFLSKNGSLFKPTALRIWEILQKNSTEAASYLSLSESEETYDLMNKTALKIAHDLFEDYLTKQNSLIVKEKNRLTSYDLYQQENIQKTAIDNIKNARQQKLAFYNESIDTEIKAFLNNTPKLHCYSIVTIGE